MSEYLRLPFLFEMTIEAGEALTEQDVIPQYTTTPLSADEQVPEKTDSQQRVEASDPKIVATRIRKANAAAKRKAEKNRESGGAGGSEGSSKRRKPSSGPGEGDKEKGDNVISPTQTQGDNLVEIPAHDSANTIPRLYEEHHDEHSGVLGNRDGNFDDDVDEVLVPEGSGPLSEVNLIPPGVREEMNLLDNNVVLDRAWFSLARGAMAQAHTLSQFESLYDTHHALQESLETTRGPGKPACSERHLPAVYAKGFYWRKELGK
ncbi:hypothetical protein Tco_0725408 [Tanacetum coccineum]|uniref:Uncharacterized protein n=1 Tax=Tanacetum coccineum TaxID=301880 RepID=A0ABQ4YDM6_9ASTR